jgi:hypothetical protein
MRSNPDRVSVEEAQLEMKKLTSLPVNFNRQKLPPTREAGTNTVWQSRTDRRTDQSFEGILFLT